MRGVLADGFANDGTLRPGETPGCPLQCLGGFLIHRERHLYHIAAILPYSVWLSAREADRSGHRSVPTGRRTKDAGPHSVSFAGRSLAVGTYFAVLSAEGQRLTRTIILQ